MLSSTCPAATCRGRAWRRCGSASACATGPTRSMRNGPIPAIPTRSISARPGRSSCRPRRSGDLAVRVLATLHRWWGVAFCLLFAMWFASGIVMHFVPLPARSERAATHAIDESAAGAELIDYDQWTVAGDFDSDRPMFRYALNDNAGTEIYISSRSGKAVLT